LLLGSHARHPLLLLVSNFLHAFVELETLLLFARFPFGFHPFEVGPSFGLQLGMLEFAHAPSHGPHDKQPRDQHEDQ
jgi:hypothetical protein